MPPKPRPTFGLSKDQRRLLAQIAVADNGLDLLPTSADFPVAKSLYDRSLVVYQPAPGYRSYRFRASQLGHWMNNQRTIVT